MSDQDNLRIVREAALLGHHHAASTTGCATRHSSSRQNQLETGISTARCGNLCTD